MKRFYTIRLLGLIAWIGIVGLTSCADKQNDRDAQMSRFVDDLMSRMTLEEKLGQLNLPVAGDIVTGAARESNVAENIRQGRVGGLFNLKGAAQIREIQRIAVEESRLGIPILFGMDVIHGYETVFPIPLALSCSWDMEAIERSAQIAAEEATADGICWTFSPMVDICHDGRWGRISEGNGEDPYLGSRIAEAMVRGYQGNDLTDPTTMMACVKHFALYGAVEAGREYNNVYPDDYHMFNEYLQPYKAAVDAGAGSVMAAFNTVHGIPATGNRWLLTDLLRDQWGFDGFVVSDYTAVEELMDHGVCADLESSSIQCLVAGLDMDMVSDGLEGTLAKAVQEKRLDIKYVNQACRRVLEAKYKLGLFDDPYRYCDTTRRAQVVLSPEHRAEARRIAGESMVLLKNEKQLLPLAKKGTIALIGPLADTRPNMSGTWAVAAVPWLYKTVKEGLSDALQGTGARLLYAKGSNLMYDAEAEAIGTMFGREMRDSRSDAEMCAEALRIARQADVIIAAMGEASEMSGECSSRVNIEMPDAQHDLLVELAKLGKPIVLVHFAGRPTVLNWETEHLPAILEAWFGGSETADALADILFGDVNPSGRLTVQLPRHVGQYPFSYRQMRTSRRNDSGEFSKFITSYADVSNWPLYPFGYGLSYTTFEYGPITLSNDKRQALSRNDLTLSNDKRLTTNDQLLMTNDQPVTASVTVTNTGSVPGTEVVQLYIGDRVAKGVRPYKELRGFQRISLQPGESKQVTFDITPDLLGYYAPVTGNPSPVTRNPSPVTLHWTLEPGEVEIHIGRNARETQMSLLNVQ
ncbi:MAG: beta-glucosidase BglX [Paludibacteraceae bacterium]|nr:beta-glucosidase BglX [Paludibacteraceae bacterium]